MSQQPPPVSVLDVVPVWDGSTAVQALRDTVAAATAVESLGYTRYWVAEHHSTPCLATASPPVLAGRLLAATTRLRVGSGGVLLPNHAPLVVAEQFGTLAALHGDRVDLGVGRAPGTDPRTARALRRPRDGAEAFPEDLAELRGYFGPGERPITAVAAAEAPVAVWVLGSSPGSALLAGSLGLPYAFAHQINPGATARALAAYRESFRPSAALDAPYAVLSAVAVGADSDAEAVELVSPYVLGQVRTRTTGSLDPFPTAAQTAAHHWSAPERAFLDDRVDSQLVGGPDTLRTKIADLVSVTGADEVMALTILPGLDDRLRSYELVAAAARAALAQPA